MTLTLSTQMTQYSQHYFKRVSIYTHTRTQLSGHHAHTVHTLQRAPHKHTQTSHTTESSTQTHTQFTHYREHHTNTHKPHTLQRAAHKHTHTVHTLQEGASKLLSMNFLLAKQSHHLEGPPSGVANTRSHTLAPVSCRSCSRYCWYSSVSWSLLGLA